MSLLLRLIALLLVLAVVPPAAGAATPKRGPTPPQRDPALAPLVPHQRTLYADGPGGRYLIDAGWQYRADDADQGLASHFELDRGHAGWAPTHIPFNWNATDTTQDAPSVGWFRTEFVPPRTGRFTLRFE